MKRIRERNKIKNNKETSITKVEKSKKIRLHQNYDEGITLVALVVTIIIIIILSTITITGILGENGLISQARETKDRASNMLESEGEKTNELLANYANEMKKESNISTPWQYDEEGNITNGIITLKIGDYVDYDCTTSSASYTSTETLNGYRDQTFTASSYEYGWRVLGVDEDTGEILLISEEIVEPTSGGYDYSSYNRTYYRLRGQAGHVNGISELNKISAIYGKGTGATGARSITVEDINKITGYNPNNVGVYDPEQTGSGTKYGASYIYEYGNKVTYYWFETGVIYYEATNDRIGTLSSTHLSFYWYDSASGWQSSAYDTGESGEITTLESNYYWYYPNTLTDSNNGQTEGISTESTAYKMLFTNSSTGANTGGSGLTDGVWYWLGSSYVGTGSSYAGFGLRGVYRGGVGGCDLYYSYGTTGNDYCGVRPVVSLESDVSLTDSGETYDGCTLWNMK